MLLLQWCGTSAARELTAPGTIKDAYYEKNGDSNDVQSNDVFFALHALLLTVVTAAQCMLYEKGSQTVNYTFNSV